jgi:hypothetical protein
MRGILVAAVSVVGSGALVLAGCDKPASSPANNDPSQGALTYDQAIACEVVAVEYNILAGASHDEESLTSNRAIQDAWKIAAENDATRVGKTKEQADSEFDAAGAQGFGNVDSFVKGNPSGDEQVAFNKAIVNKYNPCAEAMMRSALWNSLISNAVKEAAAKAAASNAATPSPSEAAPSEATPSAAAPSSPGADGSNTTTSSE